MNMDYEINNNVRNVMRLGDAIRILLIIIGCLLSFSTLITLIDSGIQGFVVFIFIIIPIIFIFVAAFWVKTYFYHKAYLLLTRYEMLKKMQ